MLYNYYFCIAAMISSISLGIIFFAKRSVTTTSNNLFLMLIINNILIAIVDILSCFTISYPERYSTFMLYASNISYLFLYNAEAGLFLLYIHSMTHSEETFKKTAMTVTIIGVLELLLIISTPFTHAVIYFDSNEFYLHGPMMLALYIFSFAELAIAAALVISGRNKFYHNQYISLILFIVGVIICVIVQAFIPRLVIAEFSIVLFLTMVYGFFENPAYYRFKDSSCFNETAFFTMLRRRLRRKKYSEILTFHIDNFSRIQYLMGNTKIHEMCKEIAENLHISYKENAFMISERRFIVINDSSLKKTSEEIENEVIKMCNNIDSIKESKISLDFSNHLLTEDVFKNNLYEGTLEEIFDIIFSDVYVDVNEEMKLSDVVEKTRRRDKILQAIDKAIEEKSLQVYFQPIFHVNKKTFGSAEALVRLVDPELGIISPAEFIPIAEETGRISKIDYMVIEKTCELLTREDLTDKGIQYIELNLSVLQFQREEAAEEMLQVIDSYKIPHQMIKFEITESFELNMQKAVEENIHKLLSAGVEFSVDDFGSGYAAMNYLMHMPVTMIKVDKSILWGAKNSERGKMLLKNIMQMIKDMEYQVLVEGAEDQEMVDILIENGCDFIQGYFYSKPLQEKDFLAFLEEKHK